MLSNKSAFTLLEVVLAVFIASASILAVFGLTQKTLLLTSLSSDRLAASYLSQEGIEIVRNIRDSNWLKQRANPNIAFNDGIPSGDWEADYNSQQLSSAYSGKPLNVDSLQLMSYSPGTETKFKRKITIKRPDPNIIDILGEVIWQERGRSHSFFAQDFLYNWNK